MAYAGRLIRPQLCILKQLDVAATRANDIDGGEGYAGGMDDLFGDIVVAGPDEQRVSARVESEIRFRVQVEPEQFDATQMLGPGTQLQRRISLIAFIPELRAKGYMNDDGTPKIKQGDRLHELRHVLSFSLITSFSTPPGVYVTEVRPLSYGLASRDQNLLQIICTDRKQG